MSLRLSLGALGLWVAFGLAVQRWASIQEGIREGWGGDLRSYLVIARAAPSFPDRPVRRPFAERFPAHWVAGAISDATGIPLEDVYRTLSIVVVAVLIVVVHATLVRIHVGAQAYVLATGVLVAGVYPLHFLLAGAGMLQDDVFLLGLALAVFGVVRGSLGLLVGGLALATLGRQTAIPVAVVAAFCIAFAPTFRRIRVRAAAVVALVPLAVYASLRLSADTFAVSDRGSFHDRSILGFAVSAEAFGKHVGRVSLGVFLAVVLVAAGWRRSRGRAPLTLLLVAAAVVVQPLVLGPASTYPGNEPRLASLAIPVLAVAVGIVLAQAELTRVETAILAFALALASLHPRYTHAPWRSSVVWVALELVAAAVVLIVILGPGSSARRPRSPAARPR